MSRFNFFFVFHVAFKTFEKSRKNSEKRVNEIFGSKEERGTIDFRKSFLTREKHREVNFPVFILSCKNRLDSYETVEISRQSVSIYKR